MTANSMTMHDIEMYAVAGIKLNNLEPVLDIVKTEIKGEFESQFGVDYERLEKLVLLHKSLLLCYTGEAKKATLEGIHMFITPAGVKYDALDRIMKLHEAIAIMNS